MAYNLIIDQGNSRAKVAVFSGHEPVQHWQFTHLTADDIDNIAKRYLIEAAIYCSVATYGEEVIVALRKIASRVYELTSMLPLPIAIDYSTPVTLGRDRIAAAAGAAALYPGRKILVVDAGTAITYDLVSADGHFVGGSIAPGLWMRGQSLHKLTKRLPEVDTENQPENLTVWGDSTQSAIRNGVMRGVAAEVIYHAEMAGDNTLTLLTGGDAPTIAVLVSPETSQPAGPRLKSELAVEPDLVSKGLNSILLYNEAD